jgi:hypothetical protein
MDIEELLKSLNAHNVEFVIIGATAFPIHGYARATLDIDIFIRPEPKNAVRTLNALRQIFILLSSESHSIMYGKIGFPELLERRRFTMPLWMTSS